MAAYDWSRFTKSIPIKAGRQAIFDSWITSAALERWFLREAIFTSKEGKDRSPDEKIMPGDTFEWRWFVYEGTENGTVLEQDGSRLKFIFGKAGTVTVTVKEENGKNICELLQEEIPTDEESKVNFHLGCSTGWGFYLANLKSLLEGGIDLRNKDHQLAHDVTV